MARVEVAALTEKDAAAVRIQEEVQQAESAVREKAHNIATEPPPDGDSDLRNWLRAEQQLFCVPDCELIEDNGQLRLRAAVPGLDARQIRLTALPGTIVIKATHVSKGERGQVHFSEFNRNTLLRRIDLPTPIDVASAKAKLERGVLEVVVSRQAKPKTKRGQATKPPKKRATK